MRRFEMLNSFRQLPERTENIFIYNALRFRVKYFQIAQEYRQKTQKEFRCCNFDVSFAQAKKGDKAEY